MSVLNLCTDILLFWLYEFWNKQQTKKWWKLIINPFAYVRRSGDLRRVLPNVSSIVSSRESVCSLWILFSEESSSLLNSIYRFVKNKIVYVSSCRPIVAVCKIWMTYHIDNSVFSVLICNLVKSVYSTLSLSLINTIIWY